VLYFLRDQIKKDPDFIQNNLNDICASVQDTIVAILMDKLESASVQEGISEIGIAGGVSANSVLRRALTNRSESLGWHTYVPSIKYCTDNAGMIAMAAHYKYEQGLFSDQTVSPNPRLKIRSK